MDLYLRNLGLGSGHYTARARNGPHWCEFNDSYAAFSHDLQDKVYKIFVDLN